MAEAYYETPSKFDILANAAMTKLYEEKASDVTDKKSSAAMTQQESTEAEAGPMTSQTVEAYTGKWIILN